MLAELHRVLRHGGVLRLTTPDLEQVIALYEDRNPIVSREYHARYLAGLTGKRYDSACQILATTCGYGGTGTSTTSRT